jgi:hypothetical protein
MVSLYLGNIKNTENIIRLENKYNPKHLCSNLLILNKTYKPGKDNADKRIIGKI